MHDPRSFFDQHQAELGMALDFGPDDLAANQQGMLSYPQIAQLDRDLRWFYGPIIWSLAGAAFLIAVSSTLAGTPAAVPIISLMVGALIATYLQRQERATLADRHVQRTMLKVRTLGLVARRWGLLDDRGPFGGVRYPVMNDRTVFGPRHLYQVLSARQSYVVYYAPVRTWRGFRLLSIEPFDDALPDEKPKRKSKTKTGRKRNHHQPRLKISEISSLPLDDCIWHLRRMAYQISPENPRFHQRYPDKNFEIKGYLTPRDDKRTDIYLKASVTHPAGGNFSTGLIIVFNMVLVALFLLMGSSTLHLLNGLTPIFIITTCLLLYLWLAEYGQAYENAASEVMLLRYQLHIHDQFRPT